MKSERMKRRGMGWGAGAKESEIVLGFRGGGVWRARWKIQYYLVAFVFLQGKTTKKEKENPNEERRDCDFVNISTKTKWNQMLCIKLMPGKKSVSQSNFLSVNLDVCVARPCWGVLRRLYLVDLTFSEHAENCGNVKHSGLQ